MYLKIKEIAVEGIKPNTKAHEVYMQPVQYHAINIKAMRRKLVLRHFTFTRLRPSLSTINHV